MMIRIHSGTATNRHIIEADDHDTLKSVMERVSQDYGVDWSRGTTNLDGATLRPGDASKTFADFGITDTCFLVNVPKADAGLL